MLHTIKISFLLLSIALPPTNMSRHADYLYHEGRKKKIGDRFYFERNLHMSGSRTDPEIQRILELSADLVQDARIKMLNANAIAKKHETTVAFNIGLVVGNIHEHYIDMLDIYHEAITSKYLTLQNSTNASDISPLILDNPTFGGENATYFDNILHYLTLINLRDNAIDQYTNVLKNIPSTEFAKTFLNETVQPIDVKENEMDREKIKAQWMEQHKETIQMPEMSYFNGTFEEVRPTRTAKKERELKEKRLKEIKRIWKHRKGNGDTKRRSGGLWLTFFP